jgi:hypothetical protein
MHFGSNKTFSFSISRYANNLFCLLLAIRNFCNTMEKGNKKMEKFGGILKTLHLHLLYDKYQSEIS